MIALGADPNITIRVLPFPAGAHPAMGSSFVHLRLTDPPDAEIIYLENMASSDYLPSLTQVGPADRESPVVSLSCTRC